MLEAQISPQYLPSYVYIDLTLKPHTLKTQIPIDMNAAEKASMAL